MLKVVYVLVSDLKDYFYEQMLISIASLRYRMDSVNIILLTEQVTGQLLKEKRAEVYSLVDRVVIHKVDGAFNMAEKSRILKTKMRNIIEGDFLYIDCDTVVCENLEQITEIKCTGAVLDNHQLVNREIYEFRPVVKRAEIMGYSCGYQDKHFNTGVMWCKDDPETHQFCDLWHRLWLEGYKKGILYDQLSLNEANNRMGGRLQELNGEWNCQLRYGLPYLAEAKIIHYFASNFSVNSERTFAYLLTDPVYLKAIRKERGIPDIVNKMIEKPRSAFHYAIIVDTGSLNYILMNSNMGALLRFLYRKHKKIFIKTDRILEATRKAAERCRNVHKEKKSRKADQVD